MALELRPLDSNDERAARMAHAELREEQFPFLLPEPGDLSWGEFIQLVDDMRHARALPSGWAPTTYLVAVVAGEIVGRLSVRHELTDHLRRSGGHIGYAVRPAYRKRGYAQDILRRSLSLAHHLGLARVLLTVEEGNASSIAVIERCGGVRARGWGTRRHYWIIT